MNGTWHLITGEYPPQQGGVSDYTATLARALADTGRDVHVWAPPAAAAWGDVDGRVRVHRLPDVFGKRGLALLTQGLDACPDPRTLLVQYVPHAFGSRGMNVAFCRWVQQRARHSRDDVRVMFHEPYYPFGLWPLHRNVLAAANRLMAMLLLSDLRSAYVSTTAWARRLRRYAPRALTFEWLPIPAAIPVVHDADRVTEWRRRIAPVTSPRVVGHFGTYGALITPMLAPALAQLLRTDAEVRVCLIGSGSEAFAARLTGDAPAWGARVTATGQLAPADVSVCLQACDVMLQPYADGASGRRTTLMAALANGVAVVTNAGAATEDVWSSSDGVWLAPDATSTTLREAVTVLLDDEDARRRIATAGQVVYAQRFAIAHTIATLLARRSGAA
ncbi:MAG TPA: glycosyltransferase family 4 protein [Gemmatimonadaceae bacterium]|nr:glycosyltransferase family 4 protein [Gemmatimonadaceae bacterium]